MDRRTLCGLNDLRGQNRGRRRADGAGNDHVDDLRRAVIRRESEMGPDERKFPWRLALQLVHVTFAVLVRHRVSLVGCGTSLMHVRVGARPL